LEILLKAFPKVREQFPNLRILIAGPGDPEELIEEVPTIHRSAITYIGMVTNDEKPDVFASGTVYVAPNTGGESFGIVLLEAMASGTPVLSSNLQAFERVLDYGKAGVTFKNGDSDDLAQVLIKLLSDDKKLIELREAGLARSAYFDWTLVANRVLEVYESVRNSDSKVEPDFAGQMFGRLSRLRISPERSDV
jgi:phosphatidylinositol alpha-mannosyltransferase